MNYLYKKMGKKNKKDKKGKGLEKTERKTEKNLGKKQKKILQNTGEEDIAALIAQFQAEDKKKNQVFETTVDVPPPRSNFSFTSCPDREEIVLFGGEYFNGKKTYVYSDLFIYSCKKDEWIKVDAPNSPPPRCGHQTVYMKVGNCPPTLWIFGGEFASPSQSQFYHYKDLWSFDLKKKSWKMITDKNGPTARSGHRMVAWKKNLIVFGGFQDTGLKCKYFNDLWQFDTDTSQWSLLKPVGDKQPSPRSGCIFLCSSDSRNIYVVGGYTKEKVKRDVDKGIIHSDIFQLKMQSSRTKCNEGDKESDVFRWNQIKVTGAKPTPRCGMSGVITPVPGQLARVLVFGGVWDEEEDEESVCGTFYDNLMSVDLERGKWYGDVEMKTAQSDKSRRRATKDNQDDTEETTEEENVEDTAPPESNLTTINDGVFTLTVSSDTGGSAASSQVSDPSLMEVEPSGPCARMNAGMAVVGHHVYVYGGMYEVGNRQITLDDMFKLDLNRLYGWETLREGAFKNQEWLGSDSESDTDTEMLIDKPKKSTEKMDADSSSDDEDDELVEDAPVPTPNETFTAYWSRTSEFWCQLIKSGLEEDDDDDDESDNEEDGASASNATTNEFTPLIKKYALQTAKDFYREQINPSK